ncbi:hypothetical protein EK0264_09560 [Epidermidibacterium keratini]|uniref:YqgE/AlgH family protein n=1 Tax=Epidermidibacterium keratini TaxID=1891644 RepID=A0A7L4YNN5_9ACTN|nr:YqgE/AlgH family protein [Epidermidibacterium keratini]QHC00503.1 hypothetical protein EK0264_09560 [Epidermidibacterium keratini]
MTPRDRQPYWPDETARERLTRPAVGRLLVAMPMLGDANFDRTVVLIVAAEEGGFQGVIISEPTRDDVRSLLPKWWQASMPPRKLHRGGPCSPEMVMCLAVGRPRLSVPGLARVVDYPHQTLYRIEGDVDPESVLPSVGGVRLFAGYAGWGGAQLDDEIDAGAWLCVASEAGDAMSAHSATLWRDVLARQRGSAAFLRHCPDNPLRN